jgi:hypothetical protein
MTKPYPQDEKVKILIKKFCEKVFWLRQLNYIFRELIDDASSRSLLERTAHAFFLDLNKIIIEYFLLEAAKLTDPATSLGGLRENFTLANLIETVEWPPDSLHEIKKLKRTVMSFRCYIKTARNRLLAHYDKSTVIKGYSLGVFPEGKDQEFLETLEKICNVMHNVAFGQIYGEIVPQHSGDVLDLKKVLKRGIAFEKLFSNSKGDDLIRLSELLDKVDRDRI